VFDYTQGAALTSNRDVYDPITTLLDYYVLLIIGYDYDSFSEFGGTPYFERARIAADLAKNASGTGWSKLGGERGRTTIVEELLDPRFRDVRIAYYTYHLKGLDLFVSKLEDARLNVLEAVKAMKTVYDSNARSYVMDLFFSVKYKELVEILRESPVGAEAYDMLAELDLQHVSDYQVLIE
jgi:hypothetical protein